MIIFGKDVLKLLMTIFVSFCSLLAYNLRTCIRIFIKDLDIFGGALIEFFNLISS